MFAPPAEAAAFEQALREAWTVFDPLGLGRLSLREFTSACGLLGVPATEEDIAREFRRIDRDASRAIELDEFGVTLGMVTQEDILEEIVGEIDDEYDETERTVIREAGAYTLAGSLHADEVDEACGFKMPDGDYETLAGFALDELQRIGQELEGLLREVPGTLSVFAERVVGGHYVDFEIDRQAIARHGLTVGDVQDVIAAAVTAGRASRSATTAS